MIKDQSILGLPGRSGPVAPVADPQVVRQILKNRRYDKDRMVLTALEYLEVLKSIRPYQTALARAIRALIDPDGVSARDYSVWAGQPGSEDFCAVDACGNAMVILPKAVTEQADRPLISAEMTYFPGWFLQCVLRTVVDLTTLPSPAMLATLEPLFDGHSQLGQAPWLETAWIDMPVDMHSGAIASDTWLVPSLPPQPLSTVLTERPWCPHARGFRPFSIYHRPSSWSASTGPGDVLNRLHWSRPRIAIVALTGVDMQPERIAEAAVRVYRTHYDAHLNLRFRLEHKATMSDQAVRFTFNRVRRPELVPQGWQGAPPDFGRARPEAFLPPRFGDVGPAERAEPVDLPPMPEGFEDAVPEDDDVVLQSSGEFANLPPPRDPATLELDEPLDLDPLDAAEDAATAAPGEEFDGADGEDEGGVDAPLTTRSRASAAPPLPHALAMLYSRPQERHLDYVLHFITTSGELFGFFSKEGLRYGNGKDLGFLLEFTNRLAPLVAQILENPSEMLTGKLSAAFTDFAVLEPLLLDLTFADPKDGDCHFEVSVEMLKDGGAGRNVPQAGQVAPVPEIADDSGTDVELIFDGFDTIAPRVEDLPESQPYYRVRIRHTGDLKVGLRQPISNLLGLYLATYLPFLPTFGLNIAGFIDLYVETVADRSAFDTLPYDRWRATEPRARDKRELATGDVLSHEHSLWRFGDLLSELEENFSLIGGFTPAFVMFDIIDVLHFAADLITTPYNLVTSGELVGRNLFGQRVEPVEHVIMLLALAPFLSKSKIKMGVNLVAATGAFGLLGWTAKDAALGDSAVELNAKEMAEKYGGYTRMHDLTPQSPTWWTPE